MKRKLAAISITSLLSLNSCMTVNTARTEKTCTIEGAAPEVGYYVTYKPGVTIYAIDESPVKVNLVHKVVVDAGKRKIVAQTTDSQTFKIVADLKEGRTYLIEADFGGEIRVIDKTGGLKEMIPARISLVEGYRKRGWP